MVTDHRARINFWDDVWREAALLNGINYHFLSQLNINLKRKVFGCLVDNSWVFLTTWLDLFPFLEGRTKEFCGVVECSDSLLWKYSNNDKLSLKDAYQFKHHDQPATPWVACIWSSFIPPVSIFHGLEAV